MINDGLHLAEVAAFVAAEDLTARIARLEGSLVGADAGAAAACTAEAGFTPALLQAARRTRAELGRIDDLIHATAISLLLPVLLEPGERVEKLPSLASGNDPGRLFDLETTTRVCEFKFSDWKGADSARKKSVVKDLVGLVLHGPAHKQAELWVVGSLAKDYLERSNARIDSVLVGERIRDAYLAAGWDLTWTVREFRAGPAAHVRVRLLDDLLERVHITD